MHLTAYLDRIGYTGPLEPTVETLRALHRAHLLSITYENLDIHRGRYLTLDEAQFFRKIVSSGRGGWCYEMNGLFAWALREMGFAVTLLAGAVNRPLLGGEAEGNHLCLLVELDEPYLADVGFGNGIREPLPLQCGLSVQDGFAYRLGREGERWFFENTTIGGPGFDFTLRPRSLSDFSRRCHSLQTSPESGFVRYTVCHRATAEGFVTLKGATLRTVTPGGVTERVIESRADFERVLHTRFGIVIHESGPLWDEVRRAHAAWMASLGTS